MDGKETLKQAAGEVLEKYMGKPLTIAGNWKMNMMILEGKQFLRELEGIETPHRLLIFPPYTALEALAPDFYRTGIGFGPQNFHYESSGAYTGEISLPMIREIGCRHVLVGHSERRAYYHETDEEICKKAAKASGEGFQVMLCIGETLEERESGRWREVLKNQLRIDLGGTDREKLKSITVAYEPVWAIGTGKSAGLEQIGETHRYIKDTLLELFGQKRPVLYGGSVNEKNAGGIGSVEGVDGFLVGGASLKADSFRSIVNAVRTPSGLCI